MSLAHLFAFLIWISSIVGSVKGDIPFYVGTAPYAVTGKGIYLGSFDPATGHLDSLKLVAELPSPSFLAVALNHRCLYAAVMKGGGNRLVAYQIEDDGRLRELNRVDFVSGHSADHISIDATGSYLLAASWNGTVATFPIRPNGSLGPEAFFYRFSGSGPAQFQESAHCHSIYTDPANRFAYVCDLGSDTVGILKFEAATGSLSPITPFAHVPPGSGPRHLAFSSDGRFVYVNNQMGLTVSVFSRDASTGLLTPIKTIPTVPRDATLPKTTDTSEILPHPSGRWLYVGNRRYDSIAVYAIQSDGTLLPVEDHRLNLKDPVNFAIDSSGQWMIVAGQDDAHITVLRIDPSSGKLSQTDQEAAVVGPSCVVFAPP